MHDYKQCLCVNKTISNKDNYTSLFPLPENQTPPFLFTFQSNKFSEHTRPGDAQAPLWDYSYRNGIHPRQQAVFNACIALVGVCGLIQPILTASIISWMLLVSFSALILFRLMMVLTAIALQRFHHPPDAAFCDKGDLPTFTILIAAYQEASMMEQLARALDAISWPQDKLEILILMEADDHETQAAAQAAAFSDAVRLITVPPDGPRTKPNALNHGLNLAGGKYVTVYDVEDVPHPNQLWHAHSAFERSSAQTVCVQAPLVAVNERASWLAAHWALEYDVQFGLLLPSLSRHGLPILLGGTSNHFRRATLLAAGGWDAWNVTEDADLGVRLARAGLTVKTIQTPTFESAPTRFDIWCAQRSRWLKGFLQTWLVLMRNPARSLRQMGPVRFLAAQLSLGGAILAPLAQIPCVCLMVLALWSGHLEVGRAGLTLFFAGLGVGLMGDVAAPGKWSAPRLFAIATRPLYWPLHSVAAYRALWELAKKPFFWAKTPHQPHDVEPGSFYSTGS